MFDLFRLWFGSILRIVRTQRSLVLENLVLRQQLVVLKRKHPKPRLGPLDKLFWLGARRFWPQWKEALVIVLPDTVVRWHRSGFTLYWTMLCKVRKQVGGGRRISRELFLVGSRELVSAKAVGFLQGTQNAAATADGRGSLHSRRLVSDVRLEKCSAGGQTGHSDQLASQGLQALLATEAPARSTDASS